VTYPQQPQGGHPPQGGYQQQGGYPPQGGYAPQGGYQQQPGGYGPYPGPPRKNNTGLIVGIGAGVLAIVVAVVLIVVLAGDDDKDAGTAGSTANSTVPGPGLPGGGGNDDAGDGGGSGSGDGGGGGGSGSARELAETTATIIEEQDSSAIDDLACDNAAASSLKKELARLDGMDVTARVTDVEESGSSAQASIALKAGGKTENFTLEMSKEDGKWCASGV
jgi:hypothetical protein